MSLTSININVAVAAAAIAIVHATFALAAFPITNGQEARNLSGHLLATNNVSLPTNLTDGNNAIWIEQCGEDKRTVERARNLAKAAANVARFDSTLGTASHHGFTAMFKEDVLKNHVWLHLSAIYENRGLRGLRPDPAHATAPRLVCVQPNSATIYRSLQLTYDPWERCHSRQTRHPASRNAFYAFGTAYIFLCPDFLDQPLAPLGNHCPPVENNAFVNNAFVFYQDYQMYTLMSQLIRFYLQENILRPELFGMNKCVGVSVESSARNPTNFVLYTALAQQSCTAVPNPFAPPFTRRSETAPSQLPASSGQTAAVSVVPIVSLVSSNDETS